MSLAADALTSLQPATNPSNSNGPSSVVNASSCTSLPSSSSSCTSTQSVPPIRLLTRPASTASNAQANTVSGSKPDHSKEVLETTEISAAVGSASSNDGPSQSVFDTANPSVNLHEFIVTTLQQQKDRPFLLQLEQHLIDFVNDNERTSERFPSMTSYHRMLVHRVSAYFGLEHSFDAVGKSVVITKTQFTQLPKQRFKEHFQLAESGASVLPRAILKRVVSDSTAASELSCKPASVAEERPMKSIEEREAEYEQRRARIFSQPAGRVTPPASTSVTALTSLTTASLPQLSGVQQESPQPCSVWHQSGLSSATGGLSKPSVTLQRQPVGPQASVSSQKSTSSVPASGFVQRQSAQQLPGFTQTRSGGSHSMSAPSISQSPLPLQLPKRSESLERKINIGQGHQESRRSERVSDFPKSFPPQAARTRDCSSTSNQSAGWTQAGPGVLVEQGVSNRQDSKLSAQLDDLSLSKSTRKESAGSSSGNLHGSYTSTGRAAEPSFALGNYPGLPLAVQMPPGSGLVMYPAPVHMPFPKDHAIPNAAAASWSTVPRHELTLWLGQHQDAWSSPLRPYAASHVIRPPLINPPQSGPVVLEVYDFPANRPTYQTDVLLEDLKQVGASLRYNNDKIWAVFRSRAEAERALKTSFTNFKVRRLPM